MLAHKFRISWLSENAIAMRSLNRIAVRFGVFFLILFSSMKSALLIGLNQFEEVSFHFENTIQFDHFLVPNNFELRVVRCVQSNAQGCPDCRVADAFIFQFPIRIILWMHLINRDQENANVNSQAESSSMYSIVYDLRSMKAV